MQTFNPGIQKGLGMNVAEFVKEELDVDKGTRSKVFPDWLL